MTLDEEKLKYVVECIAETDRLRKKLCVLRDVLTFARRTEARWYYGGSANAAVKRASLDHSKLLRGLR